MNSHREMLDALLKGKKLCRTWDPTSLLVLDEDGMIRFNGTVVESWSLRNPVEWEERVVFEDIVRTIASNVPRFFANHPANANKFMCEPGFDLELYTLKVIEECIDVVRQQPSKIVAHDTVIDIKSRFGIVE